MRMADVEAGELQGLIGRQRGPSRWRTVTQADIDAFAALSGDHQWIHVDAARAEKESPYGQTIAHGNLTLSMVDGFRAELVNLTGISVGVNYGWDRIRFPAPVPVDSRIRVRAEVRSASQLADGWWELVVRFEVEVEETDKPAFVGDSVVRFKVA